MSRLKIYHLSILSIIVLIVALQLSASQGPDSSASQGLPESEKTDEEKAQYLLNRANRYGLFADSCRYYLISLQAFAADAKLPYYEIQSNYLLGKHYLIQLQSAEAKKHFQNAARIAEREDEFELQGFALDRLGIAYINEKLTDSAFLCYKKSSEIYRAHDLEHRLWTPLQGISQIYQINGDYEMAKRYGDQGLSSIENFDEPIAKTILLNHLLNLSRESEQLDDFAYYLNLYLEDLDPSKLGSEDMHLAAYYNTIDDPKKLIAELESAISKLSQYEPTMSLISSYYHLGKVRAKTGQTNEAIQAWTAGLEIDESIEGVGYGQAFAKNLSEAYKATENYQKALVYSELASDYANALFLSESAKKIDELLLKYETAQKENTILAQQYAIENQTRQRNLILVMASAFLALAFIFIYGLRARITGQRVIAEQQSELQKKEIRDLQQQNEVLALQAMIRGQEEERRRIAQDLHDGLGGLLSTVKLNFQGLADHESPEVTKTGILIDEACSEVRRISHNMMPHALMRMGLTAAVQDLVAQLQTGSNIDFSFQNLNYKGTLQEDQEILVYRIVQELLTNTVKHSEASSVIVQVSQYNGTFSLVVEDDGVGFDTDEVRSSTGLGVQSVKSRVHLLKGKISTESKKGEGVTITIEIPVHQMAKLN